MIDQFEFEEIVRTDCRKWQSAALRVTGNCADADDIVQTALIAAWKNREKFAGNAKLSTFIYRIVIHKAVDFVRKETARRHREEAQERLTMPPTYGFLYDAIAQLPDVYAQTVVVLLENDMHYAAAAKILECAEKTLYSRMHQARIFLKKNLKK